MTNSTAQRRSRRRCLAIALAILSSALALVACGGANKPSSTSNTSSGLGPISPNPSGITASITPRGSNNGSPSSFARSQLAAAACIRKHGIPDFPDPTFGAGGAQVNLHAPLGMLTSPAFDLAQKECAKLGLELAGDAASSEKPPAAEIAQWLSVARCMRAHGVPNFPDPTTSFPPDPAAWPAKYSAVFNLNGVDWAVPKSIDLQAPAVKGAATACGGVPLTGS